MPLKTRAIFFDEASWIDGIVLSLWITTINVVAGGGRTLLLMTMHDVPPHARMLNR